LSCARQRRPCLTRSVGRAGGRRGDYAGGGGGGGPGV